MKNTKSILISAVLMTVPFVSQADSSYVDVYQFGTGSHGESKEVSKSDSNTNSIGFAYDIYANQKFTTERSEMAMLEQTNYSIVKDKPSVPGYIGTY